MDTVILILCIALVMGLLGVYFFYFFRSFFLHTTQAPYVGSFHRQLRVMQDQLSIKPGSTILDLGCGDGKALRFFCKHFNIERAVGYDINIFAIWRGKILNKLFGHNHITLHHSRFEQADLSQYDYIYIFLFSQQVADIEPRVFQQKKSDTIVICNTFACRDHTPYDILTDGRSKIYLYK